MLYGKKTIVLPNNLAVSGVAFNGERYYATDGLSPFIFIYDNHGTFVTRVNAQRKYKKIHYNIFNRSFTCLGECGKRVYTLNDKLEEIGFIIPEAVSPQNGKIADVYYNRGFYEITYTKTIDIYDDSGMYMDTLLKAPSYRDFISYCTFGNGFELCYEDNNSEYIRINDSVTELSGCSKCKGFVPFYNHSDIIVTSNYIYTYIEPFFGYCKNNSFFDNGRINNFNINNKCCNS